MLKLTVNGVNVSGFVEETELERLMNAAREQAAIHGKNAVKLIRCPRPAMMIMPPAGENNGAAVWKHGLAENPEGNEEVES